ncbi:hypothetical protein [Streptomyces sp. Ru87]|uniref:hypothetical protein n=1 Tax=Streptomyces sp. Ru87 TaxID=2044307 RepID=UPI0015D4C01A|nr:hypothetical protein [Streptomyces sp. Ru87]
MTPTEPGPALFPGAVVVPVVRRGVSRRPRPDGRPPVVGELPAGTAPDLSVAGPSVAGPSVAGLSVAGPSVAGLSVADPSVADPSVVGT